MRGPQQLKDAENHWETDIGAWFPGERVVFRGKDLFHELGDSSWMGLLLFGITGREFNDKQIRLFEGIWTISTSYPDPRIWNNRIAALAGTSRSTGNLSMASAIAVSDAVIYGQGPMIKIIDFLFRANSRYEKGANIKKIIDDEIKKQKIYGFGRPLVKSDERIIPLKKLAEELGFGKGKYISFLSLLEKELLDSKLNLKMNIAAMDAALAADQGLDRRQFYNFMSLCFCIGFQTCFIDAFSKEPGTLFPLKCNKIQYEGIKKRKWTDN